MNNGITDPREYITFPYRVITILVFDFGLLRAKDVAVFSIKAFDIPIAFIGYTALSVLKQTTELTPKFSELLRTFALPCTFVATASNGKNSQDGTCFRAAAWNTKSEPFIAESTLNWSRTSPI
jgi:hypothetical protein